MIPFLAKKFFSLLTSINEENFSTYQQDRIFQGAQRENHTVGMFLTT